MNLNAMTDALARAEGQPQAVFDALARLVDDLVGVKLFTLITFSARSNEATRIYSNRPDAYPVAGTKKVEDNEWTRQVLHGHKTFVANTIGEIAEVFPDHELIRSLGCESCINIPAIVGGEVIGTLNCLHEAGHYTGERLRRAEQLKLPGAAVFLAARQFQQGA